MTSMFDQFEEPQSQDFKYESISAAELNALGYIQMRIEPDAPIFQKTKKNLLIPDKVSHVAVGNKFLYIAMTASGTLLRINLANSQQEEISLTRYLTGNTLSNLFLDPTGNHLFLMFMPNTPTDSSEMYYLSKKSNKLKNTTKFRGYKVTAVAWNPYNESEMSTGPILLGTSMGLIFETELVLEGEKFFTSGFSSGIEQYWRQLPNYLPLYGNKETDGLVFDIGRGTLTPISGLYFYQIPSTDKYFILAATPQRLYYFDGKVNKSERPLLQQVFNKYLNVPEDETCFFTESNLKYSRLRLWGDSVKETPITYVWMTEMGLRYGKISPFFSNDSKKPIKEIIKKHSDFINFPKPAYDNLSQTTVLPFNLITTQFHALIAYNDSIKGMSLLSKELVYEDNYNEAFGKLINIVQDQATGNVWAITEHQLFKFIITKEERHVWQFYCDQKEFDLAKKFTKNNEVHYNRVLIKEAEMLFHEKKFVESAQCYSETQSSFEEICLKFFQAEQLEALKVFLCKKLDKLTMHDQAQITMIVLVVIELFLEELEAMRLKGEEKKNVYHDLQKQFESFLALKQVSECIKTNKSSIYNLISSHGDRDNLKKLTIVNKDFEQLIKQNIYNNDFYEALNVLKGQNNRELYYQFTPILIQEVPAPTVKALIDQGRNLIPIKLLPAFVSCQEYQYTHIIRYLEFCKDILKTNEKALHNLLLSLYSKYDPDKLITYLESQGNNSMLVQYDVYFALRLCQENPNLKAACVKLSALLGMWESAVDLALTIDVDKAKEIANMAPENDAELRKKLWLSIAEHVIKSKENDVIDNNTPSKDVEKAMKLLQECELLRIEDILPYFSDFDTIDHFRSAICNSLKEYNQQIQDLKDEMDEATKAAESIREQIQSFRNGYTIINHRDVCDVCEKTLMMRAFYAFPCQHRFHTDCLLKELTPHLGPARKNKLSDLHKQLNAINNTQTFDNISTGSSGISRKDVLKADIDNIIASECLYCGENMIRNIDMPFFDDNEFDRIIKEWE
nr:vacuolar protein sorting-associated protein 18 homolog isoform X1 [Onthophagus taurus]